MIVLIKFFIILQLLADEWSIFHNSWSNELLIHYTRKRCIILLNLVVLYEDQGDASDADEWTRHWSTKSKNWRAGVYYTSRYLHSTQRQIISSIKFIERMFNNGSNNYCWRNFEISIYILFELSSGTGGWVVRASDIQPKLLGDHGFEARGERLK